MKLTPGSEHELVRDVQEQLTNAGYDPGEVTGVYDKRTKQAVAEFQLDHELNATGVVDEETLGEMDVDVDEAVEEELGGPEPEREQFRYLLAKNPNYFGTQPSAEFGVVEELEQATGYEDLTCVGYEPTAQRLEAVVHVKREYGYGGDICTSGTPEYVRFYVDWDDDGT